MRLVCAPSGTAVPQNIDRSYILYGPRSGPDGGCIGASLLRVIQIHHLQPASRAWDFLSIALAVVAADEACLRNRSADGWTREISLTVSVVDPAFWTAQSNLLQDALGFVTGDIWHVDFIGGGFLPAPMKQTKPRSEDIICLLSGGMDSLIGAIDLVAAGRRPVLVSQVAKGDKKDQARFANAIAPNCLHLQMNHNAQHVGWSERSQRARSLIFFGLGVLAATSLTRYNAGTRTELIVPENGFISLNVPLTPLRIGSLSTRTTHPHYLAKVQALLDAAGLNVQLRNPYQFKTKGEMLRDCSNQTLLKSLVASSTSCGRYARNAFTQCGRCVPCLVRRASFHSWGGVDPTPAYKYWKLSTPGPRHRDFDDVRAVAFAVETVHRRGLDAWIGGSLNSTHLGTTCNLRAVLQRGLSELEQFLKAQGVI